MASVFDRIIGDLEGLAVFVELDGGCVGECELGGDEPAIVEAAGLGVDACGDSGWHRVEGWGGLDDGRIVHR